MILNQTLQSYIINFKKFVFLSHKACQSLSPISVTFGSQVALTTPRTGRQSITGNFPSKTGTHLHLGRVRKWRLNIFPKDKTRSTDAGNRTLDPKIQRLTLYKLSQQANPILILKCSQKLLNQSSTLLNKTSLSQAPTIMGKRVEL